MSVTKTLDNDATAFEVPYVAKRSWILVENDLDATNNEAFFAIQVELTDPTAIGKVVINSGHDNNVYNIVHVPYTGAIIPICGIGYASSGTDIYGQAIATANVTEVIAWGGAKIDRFI